MKGHGVGYLLAHPVWTGIGALVGIAALLVAILVPLTTGGQDSPRIATTTEITRPVTVTVPAHPTTPVNTIPTTPTVTRAAPTVTRDPQSGTDFIGAESSQEFFHDALVVSLGEIAYANEGAGDLEITRLTLTTGGRVCKSANVPNGSAFAVRGGDAVYELEVRALDLDGASAVAFRTPNVHGEGIGCEPIIPARR